jgi:hypothetical protein
MSLSFHVEVWPEKVMRLGKHDVLGLRDRRVLEPGTLTKCLRQLDLLPDPELLFSVRVVQPARDDL